MEWHSGDLHRHSIYSSSVYGGDDDAPDSLVDIRRDMMERGYTYGALSDHHNILNHTPWLALKADGFLPLISKEISTGRGHVMALNAPVDIVFELEGEDDDAVRAAFERIVARIRACGGIAQINHPADRKAALRLPAHMPELLDLFDMVEVWNGSESMKPGTKNGDAFELWLAQLRRGVFRPGTAGSDRHRIDERKPEREIRTVVGVERFDRPSVLHALKSGHSYMTSGPELAVLVDGVSFGETARHRGEVDVSIQVSAPAEIDEILLLDDRHDPVCIPVGRCEASISFRHPVDGAHWLLVQAGTDSSCMAIGNPILLKGPVEGT